VTVTLNLDRLVFLLLMLTLIGGPELGLVLFGPLSLYLWCDDIAIGVGRLMEGLLDRL
jgi:hypothetical protein